MMMMMIIIIIIIIIRFCNKKGGFGKTTPCKDVAYKLALDGAKVLLTLR